MDEKQLSEIKARCEKATPGPWEFWWRSGGFVSNGIYDIAKVFILEDDCDFEKNGIFISHAREDIPALIAEVRRLNVAISKAIELAVKYGSIDGAHHKDWVIDQMVRALAGDAYEQIVKDACAGEDGHDTYSWEVGIAP